MARLRTDPDARRSGVVLLGVLIVVVILALLAYQYADRMTAEYTAAWNAHRYAQARSFADAGVHYAAMMLANPDNIAEVLDGNPFDNPARFSDVALPDSDNKGNNGRFRLIAPGDPEGGGTFRSGVTDEGGKINLNAMMRIDESGQALFDMLVKLPNMTDEIAAAIVDWIDTDTTPRDGGAEDEHYAGLSPPYRCKNGPLDSLEELLLVRGVTRELLFGSDLNRNNLQDLDEIASGDRGWSAFLTVWSREANRTGAGQPLAYLNDGDVTALHEKLLPAVGEEMAKFVIMYRQYGPSNSSGSTQSLGQSIAALFSLGKNTRGGSSSSQSAVPGDLGNFSLDLTKKTKQKVKSLFEMVNTQVSVPNPDSKKPATLYASPLNSIDKQREYLPKLFQACTLVQDAEIAARVNVNSAPREVLLALPNFTESEVLTIMSTRPKMSGSEPPSDVFRSPGWLLTDANIKPDLLKNMEKYITTRSQVYSMQVVGYFENRKGPTARIEAVIDTNFGRPRIVFWRDWSELGRASLP